MDIEELRKQLQQQSTVEVCYTTGLSIATVDALKSGRNKNPTTKTANKLAAFLEKKANELSSSSEKSST